LLGPLDVLDIGEVGTVHGEDVVEFVKIGFGELFLKVRFYKKKK